MFKWPAKFFFERQWPAKSEFYPLSMQQSCSVYLNGQVLLQRCCWLLQPHHSAATVEAQPITAT